MLFADQEIHIWKYCEHGPMPQSKGRTEDRGHNCSLYTDPPRPANNMFMSPIYGIALKAAFVLNSSESRSVQIWTDWLACLRHFEVHNCLTLF